MFVFLNANLISIDSTSSRNHKFWNCVGIIFIDCYHHLTCIEKLKLTLDRHVLNLIFKILGPYTKPETNMKIFFLLTIVLFLLAVIRAGQVICNLNIWFSEWSLCDSLKTFELKAELKKSNFDICYLNDFGQVI